MPLQMLSTISEHPYRAPIVPAHEFLTAGAEVYKLVFNISMGRSWTGLHYRSDTMPGVRLGKDVANSILQDAIRTCTEDFERFAFTRVDGMPVKISRNGEVS